MGKNVETFFGPRFLYDPVKTQFFMYNFGFKKTELNLMRRKETKMIFLPINKILFVLFPSFWR